MTGLWRQDQDCEGRMMMTGSGLWRQDNVDKIVRAG